MSSPQRPDGASADDEIDVKAIRASASKTAANIGQTIRRLRGDRGLSLQDVGKGAGVSASFVGALERGETDIAIGRLERLADFFGVDLGTILGYSRQEVRFNYVPFEDAERDALDPAVRSAAADIPFTGQKLTELTLEPGQRLEAALADDGMLTLHVVLGTVQLFVGDRVFNIREHDSGSFAAKHGHALFNNSDRPARLIVIASPAAPF